VHSGSSVPNIGVHVEFLLLVSVKVKCSELESEVFRSPCSHRVLDPVNWTVPLETESPENTSEHFTFTDQSTRTSK
jgi:hypothetical protein